MAFTANHYKEVARVIRDELQRCADPGASEAACAVLNVRDGLARMFWRQNPAFDAGRFARDCTPTPGQERT